MKLRNSGLMTRRTENGRSCSVRADVSLVLQGTVRTYKIRYKLIVYMFLFQIFWGHVSAKISRMG